MKRYNIWWLRAFFEDFRWMASWNPKDQPGLVWPVSFGHRRYFKAMRNRVRRGLPRRCVSGRILIVP